MNQQDEVHNVVVPASQEQWKMAGLFYGLLRQGLPTGHLEMYVDGLNIVYAYKLPKLGVQLIHKQDPLAFEEGIALPDIVNSIIREWGGKLRTKCNYYINDEERERAEAQAAANSILSEHNLE